MTATAGFPDGPYGVWRGQVFRVATAGPGRVVLTVLHGDPVPAGFQARANGRVVGKVAESELFERFSLSTYGLVDGERYLVTGEDGDRLQLSWTGRDAVRARELGLTVYERTGFFGSATRAELVALWQQRTETARADDVRSDADRPLRTEAELRQAISAAVIASVPPPWRAVDLEFREVGGHAELICRSVGADGAARFWSPHPAVSQAFGELRTTSAASERGVWLAAALRVRPDGSRAGSPTTTRPPGSSRRRSRRWTRKSRGIPVPRMRGPHGGGH